MPELPDVENFKRIVSEEALGRTIRSIAVVRHPGKKVRTLQSVTEEEFRAGVAGAAIEQLERRGKFLIAHLTNGRTIVFHFMLSGELKFFDARQKPDEKCRRHARLKFEFSDGSTMYFADPRNMGRIFLVEGEDYSELGVLAQMGTEPLSSAFTRKRWNEIISNPRYENETIKDLLTKQEEIAGIGNIYSDGILHEARIRPDRKVKSLKPAERRALFEAVPKVLKEGIRALAAGETSHEEFLAQRRKGGICPRDGTVLAAIKRGISHSYYCPKCQL